MVFSTDALCQIVADIWTSMLGFPVEARGAPVDGNGTRHLSASVQISGGWEGTVLVSCPEAPAQRVAGVMFDTPDASDDEIRDALGEVANMTAGNVKALVESYCRVSGPMVAEGKGSAISIPGGQAVATAGVGDGGAAVCSSTTFRLPRRILAPLSAGCGRGRAARRPPPLTVTPAALLRGRR